MKPYISKTWPSGKPTERGLRAAAKRRAKHASYIARGPRYRSKGKERNA